MFLLFFVFLSFSKTTFLTIWPPSLWGNSASLQVFFSNSDLLLLLLHSNHMAWHTTISCSYSFYNCVSSDFILSSSFLFLLFPFEFKNVTYNFVLFLRSFSIILFVNITWFFIKIKFHLLCKTDQKLIWNIIHSYLQFSIWINYLCIHFTLLYMPSSDNYSRRSISYSSRTVSNSSIERLNVVEVGDWSRELSVKLKQRVKQACSPNVSPLMIPVRTNQTLL